MSSRSPLLALPWTAPRSEPGRAGLQACHKPPSHPSDPERGPLAGPRRRTRSVHPPQKLEGVQTPSGTPSRRLNIFFPSSQSTSHEPSAEGAHIPVQASGPGEGQDISRAESPTHRAPPISEERTSKPPNGRIVLPSVGMDECRAVHPPSRSLGPLPIRSWEGQAFRPAISPGVT
jgi:hypothetical protein